MEKLMDKELSCLKMGETTLVNIKMADLMGHLESPAFRGSKSRKLSLSSSQTATGVNFKLNCSFTGHHDSGDVIVEPHIHDVINKIKNKRNTKIILQNNVIHAWLCVTWYKTENHKGLKQISTWIEKLRK